MKDTYGTQMAVALSEHRSSSAVLHWFALHVKPRAEVSTQMALENRKYETMLPVRTTRRQWSDRVKEIDQPLFPGYLFCRFVFDMRFPVLLTPGVNYVVGINRGPTPIPDAEIEALRLIHTARVDAEPLHYGNPGLRVRIVGGPLRGLTGLLDRTDGKDRLVVSVNLLRRSIAIGISTAWVVPDDGFEMTAEAGRRVAELSGSGKASLIQ